MGVAMRLRTPNLHAALASSSLPVCSAGRTSFLTSLQVPTPLRSSCHLPSLALNRRAQRSTIVMQAADGSPGPTKEEEEVIDNKILQYCSIDKKTAKRTVGELEQEFLEALQSFYYEGKPMMSNEEFDNLKEELMWEGSSIVMLSPDEQRFMEASLAYAAGKPILTDAAYDELKMKLKKQSSKVAIEGPRCSLRSKKVYSDCTVDYLKMTLLNVPAALVALGLVFFLDDVTGFEITYLLELPEPYSFLFTWFIVLPVTYLIAQSLTNVIVKDPLILKGPCPNCGGGTTSFFGTILTIPSGGSVNTVQCESCKSSLLYDLEARLITLDPTPPKEKKSKAPKKAVASS
ncbi:hypothetical protein MPTK1_5g09890 [Marchantia polymorpha subsp. ruderalis]|uniref:PGR5-like protein 1A, chloroplastic n=2 Tax=Marchantia polymorpha TaxID=3197 RepID=A0AAF6BGR2_MARPO|nr:hypothetical protein MARPO_0048s0082 [Marchantia polymorpha]BBN11196.1 hypothetical protein Mp_5g09890 [Marchantia polymorpha subsp. ruderalis]|eukprot:PTQ38973.1 hypothetical protein MARPO_0048s0082 [Marchantia polymorpha]